MTVAKPIQPYAPDTSKASPATDDLDRPELGPTTYMWADVAVVSGLGPLALAHPEPGAYLGSEPPPRSTVFPPRAPGRGFMGMCATGAHSGAAPSAQVPVGSLPQPTGLAEHPPACLTATSRGLGEGSARSLADQAAHTVLRCPTTYALMFESRFWPSSSTSPPDTPRNIRSCTVRRSRRHRDEMAQQALSIQNAWLEVAQVLRLEIGHDER
jgi:hypothetical protein